MTTVNEIPLIPSSQTFGIVLNNVPYKMTVTWRDVAAGALGDLVSVVGGGWVLDIADQAGNPFVSGIPLVTGADLLDQLEYLGIAEQFLVQTSHDVDAVPTYTNLGLASHLYAVT